MTRSPQRLVHLGQRVAALLSSRQRRRGTAALLHVTRGQLLREVAARTARIIRVFPVAGGPCSTSTDSCASRYVSMNAVTPPGTSGYAASINGSSATSSIDAFSCPLHDLKCQTIENIGSVTN